MQDRSRAGGLKKCCPVVWEKSAGFYDYFALCGSRKYPYSPHRRDWKFRGGGGVSKTQKFKAMYEAKMEFPEGWGGGGVTGKIPSVGGYGYFLEPHIL